MHSLRPLAATAAVLTGLLTAGGASGAGWSAPQPIPGSEGDFPVLARLLTNGAADVFAHGPLKLSQIVSPQLPVGVALRAPGGAFGPLTSLGAYAEPIALSPSDRQLIAVAGPRSPADFLGGANSAPAKLRVVMGRPGGALRRVRTGGAVGTRTLAAAVNDAGDAAVMYARCRNRACATTSVWAMFRRHRHAFSRPVALAGRSHGAAGAVVLDRSGDALMAWEESRGTGHSRELRTRMRIAASGRLTPLHRAGPTEALPTVALTLTAGRTGTIAWFSEAVSEGSAGGTATTSVVRMKPDGSIGSRRVLDRFSPPGGSAGNAVGGARLRAILDSDGRTTLAWTGHDQRYVVRAVRVPGRMLPVTLSPGGLNSELVDLAGDAAGDAAAVWIGGAQPAAFGGTPEPGVGVALRMRATGTFAFPELPLVNTSSRVYGSAAVAIAGPAGHVLLAAGGPFIGNATNPPPVVVLDRSG